MTDLLLKVNEQEHKIVILCRTLLDSGMDGEIAVKVRAGKFLPISRTEYHKL